MTYSNVNIKEKHVINFKRWEDFLWKIVLLKLNLGVIHKRFLGKQGRQENSMKETNGKWNRIRNLMRVGHLMSTAHYEVCRISGTQSIFNEHRNEWVQQFFWLSIISWNSIFLQRNLEICFFFLHISCTHYEIQDRYFRIWLQWIISAGNFVVKVLAFWRGDSGRR